jgi:hypothetical protein
LSHDGDAVPLFNGAARHDRWSIPMSPHRTLIAASVVMAALWTIGMLWWLPPTATVGYVIQAAAGAIVGIVWYTGMRVWMACCPQDLTSQ